MLGMTSGIKEDDKSYVFDWDAVFAADDYLYFYDDTLISERTEHQVDFLEQHLCMLPGMRVLDVGCGHGRHALELAHRGYSVVGLERMPGFLSLARQQAEAAGLEVEWVEGDAREFDRVEQFDRVVCLFDVFGLHRDDENADVLRRIHHALRPGGRACIDVRNRDWIIRSILPVTIMQKGQDLMIDRHSFDPLTGRLVDFRLMVRDGQVKQAPLSVRLYSFTELRSLLTSVGFEVTDAFGTWDGAPIGLQHNRMVLMVEKAR